MTREELETWAKDTIDVYHGLANHDWSKIPVFYTQSDLRKLIGTDSVDVFIAGINPGSDKCSYQEIINDPNSNWGIDPQFGITPKQLISGNFCKNPDKGNQTSWQLHETWPYFIRLKGYFSLVIGGNPLEDEKRFVLTNASFFATCKACQLPKNSIQQTILCTIELIEKSSPKRIVFLSGKAAFKILQSIKSDKLRFEIKSEANDILHGCLNGIPCLGLPHPSAHLTNVRRKQIALILKDFFEAGELKLDDSVPVMPTLNTRDSNSDKEERKAIMLEMYEYMKTHHPELQLGSKEDGWRHDQVGFSDSYSMFELYFTDVKNNGIQIFTKESQIIELLKTRYSFVPDKQNPFKLIIDYSKLTSAPTDFIDIIINEISSICSTTLQP